MSLNQLLGTIVGAWACITLGLVMLTGAYGIVPLSVGIGLGAVAWIYSRKIYFDEVYGSHEEKKP
jgi:hypothetical protein